MTMPRRVIACGVCFGLGLLAAAAPVREETRALWNGRDLDGWISVRTGTTPTQGWVVADGVLTVEGKTGGDIITTETFGDFDFECEFLLTKGANSGIKYFAQPLPDKPGWVGLEYQVLDDAHNPEATNAAGTHAAGALYELIAPPADKPLRPAGEWNHARIVSRGTRIEHWLNGRMLFSYERGGADFRERVANSKYKTIPGFGLAPEGRILLQDHNDRVSYRNIRLRAPVRMPPTPPGGGLAWSDDGRRALALYDGPRPVLVYNYGTITNAMAPGYDRGGYIHPLFDSDGRVLTDDFPSDHRHHRGLFWAWTLVVVDGKEYDTWIPTPEGMHTRFEQWIEKSAAPTGATLIAQNGWYARERRVMDEKVRFDIHPMENGGRWMDIDLALTPVDVPVMLGSKKGPYGGLALRFAPRKAKSVVITTDQGVSTNDLTFTKLTRADFSADFQNGGGVNGATLLARPDHPDFPPMWLTRHYGCLCLNWPGKDTPRTLAVGETVRFRYRLWIHRDGMEPRRLAAMNPGA